MLDLTATKNTFKKSILIQYWKMLSCYINNKYEVSFCYTQKVMEMEK